VLGPLQVMQDVDALEPGSPKQRALLIDLLVHHGEVVSWDQLIEDLWAGSPPLPASACCRTTCRSGDSNSWHWGSPGLRHLRRPLDLVGQHDDQVGPEPSPPAIQVRTTNLADRSCVEKRRRAKVIPRFPDKTLKHGRRGGGLG